MDRPRLLDMRITELPDGGYIITRCNGQDHFWQVRACSTIVEMLNAVQNYAENPSER